MAAEKMTEMAEVGEVGDDGMVRAAADMAQPVLPFLNGGL